MVADTVAAHAGSGLSKQVGPLPLGAWIAVIGGGLGIAYFFNNKKAATPPIDTSQIISNPGVGVGGGQFVSIDPPPVPPATAPPQITTNIEWGQAAAQYLLAQNDDPALIDAAIRDYLFGNSLNTREQAVISAAIKKLGIPPEPLPPVNAPPPVTIPSPPKHQPPPTPPPPPTPAPPPPPPPPPPPRTFTVDPWPAQGSTLWGIAQIMYGNGIRWPDIYNANRNQIANPSLIYPGQVLIIP